MNSRYFYAYSPSLTAQSGSSAVRVFNLPCEEIPNGSFERFTGSLPTSGFNNWVSPYFGSITCNVNLGGYVGNNGCHTWGFNNGSGVYNVPLGIDVALEEGKTYEVSCWVWVRGATWSRLMPGRAIISTSLFHPMLGTPIPGLFPSPWARPIT